jgi:hypothetical protein
MKFSEINLTCSNVSRVVWRVTDAAGAPFGGRLGSPRYEGGLSMRESVAMAQLSAEEDKQEMVTLSNLRCLMPTVDTCCSPPPCPPPSSTSSSASSSPRPDTHPESPEVMCPSPTGTPVPVSSSPDPVESPGLLSSDQCYTLTPKEHLTVQQDASSLVQIIASAHRQEGPPASTKDISDNYSGSSDHVECSVSAADNAKLYVAASPESSETDNEEEEEEEDVSSVSSDASVVSREAITWGLLSPKAPLAAAEESADEEENTRMGNGGGGAQNQVACVRSAAVRAAAVHIGGIEVHVPHGSILSNVPEEEQQQLTSTCSAKVSGQPSTTTIVTSSLAPDARLLHGDVGNQLDQQLHLHHPPESSEFEMRQKPSSSSSNGASSATVVTNDSAMQQQHSDHQNTNNNAECPLQCNGMVSECCWNGDCVEARTASNLKPAIKLNSEKRQENGRRRVTFNETLNKFFDADYVILVGEDCNGDETTRLVSMCKKSSCQPGGNFDLNFPELCPFEPPLEYIDQVTLSPPEGYKDVLGAARGAQDDESGN